MTARERKKQNPRFPSSEVKHTYRFINRVKPEKYPPSTLSLSERMQFISDLEKVTKTRDAAEIERLKALCGQIDRELKEAGGPEARDPRYRRLNLEFHSAIHRLARAPLACAVAAGMWDRSDFFIKVAFGSLYFNRRVRHAHLAIRRAIVDGDPRAAEAAIATHLRQVGEAVATRLGSDLTD